MAAPAYKINDRRSSSGYTSPGYYGANRLIEPARQNRDRKFIPMQDRDFHRNISAYGRRTLLSLGRWMFWNIPEVQGQLLEQANLAVSTFIPQFYGANKDWGNGAELWLTEWHKIFDIAGWPYDYESYLQTLVLSPLVDGDVGTLLTETPDGYPLIQVIPAHRIYSNDDVVKGGEFDGAALIDGCIINEYGRTIGYRVYDDNFEMTNYRDISTRDMFLSFYPLFPGQLRGLSALASSAFHHQDKAEYDRFELLAQKACAATALIETNETGDVDSSKAIIKDAATFNSDNTQATPTTQLLDGGSYRYFKANTNSKLEAFHYDRPGANATAFQDRKTREAFRGTEWDSFFSLDPGSVGGAPMRIIVEKINRVLEKRRRLVSKACVRVDGYGIAKAIKNKDLAEDVDWWKWEHQGPGDVTADRKYDSDVDLQEVAQGFSTRKKACGKRGDYWEENDKQREAEARSDLMRAQRLATEFKITIQEALVVLRPPTPNQQLPQPQPEPTPTTQADK